MSELDKLLQGYAPPPVPAGLAQRAAAEAIEQPQEAGRGAEPRRGDRRGGWKRPLWIGATSFGLAFTSAVAATVVSGGRIEIPVVHQVVEAVPVLKEARQRNEPPKPVAEVVAPKPAAPDAEQPVEAKAAMPAPGEPGWRKARVAETLVKAKQHVEARRAAGLPTPRADRIERQAKAIVERREAAGLPTPTVEEVEAGLALREMRRMWLMRRAGRLDPSMLTEQQLMRIANHLPPQKRERFLALSPEMQRQLVVQQIERMRARRAIRQGLQQPAPEVVEPSDPVEPPEPENVAQ